MRKQTEYQKQRVRETFTTHGMSKTKVYKVWAEMKQRCDNRNSVYYHNYGGRGISYSETWRLFENFFMDIGHPTTGMSLDRIDNNGNYCKENCRWSTRSEQMNNTRQTHFYTIDNITKTATQWSKELGITSKSLNRRRREGWTDEEILSTPRNKNRRKK